MNSHHSLFKLLHNYLTKWLGLTTLCAGEKLLVDYLKRDCMKKRAFAGMSFVENSDVTLRMPSVMAELAEEGFLVFSCLFQF